MSMADITPAALGAAVRVEEAFDGIDAQQGSGEGVISDGFIRIAGEFQKTASADAAAASLRSLSGEVHASAAAATYDTLDGPARAGVALRRPVLGRQPRRWLAAGAGRDGVDGQWRRCGDQWLDGRP